MFSKQTLHHFRILFPLPVSKIQNCLKKMQNLNSKKSSGVCISFSGLCNSPETSQLLYDAIVIMREYNRLPVYSFLEDKATSLTYWASTPSNSLIANPYALLGDIGTTHKTYRNVKQLLDFVGVKYQEIGLKEQSNKLWNGLIEANERQKEITKRWLQVVEQNMMSNVAKKRNISEDVVKQLKSKLFTPKEAQQNKLIDSISTFEEFSLTQFPNHEIQKYTYTKQSIKTQWTQQEGHLFKKIQQILEMPQVALYSIEDPLEESLRSILELIKIRLSNPAKLEELDEFIGEAMLEFKNKESQLIF